MPPTAPGTRNAASRMASAALSKIIAVIKLDRKPSAQSAIQNFARSDDPRQDPEDVTPRHSAPSRVNEPDRPIKSFAAVHEQIEARRFNQARNQGRAPSQNAHTLHRVEPGGCQGPVSTATSAGRARSVRPVATTRRMQAVTTKITLVATPIVISTIIAAVAILNGVPHIEATRASTISPPT